MHYLEDVFDEELGVSAKRKKRRAKIKKKLKKGLKGVAAISTGGLSLAAPVLKKTKVGKKVLKGLKAVATGGVSLAVKSKLAKKVKKIIPKIKSGKLATAEGLKAKTTIRKVKAKKAGDCSCKNDMAKLVAAKMIAELGPPLNEANRALAKLELQRQATYEHKKLMTDAEFRRKVLGFIAGKAATGNKSARRTISCLRS